MEAKLLTELLACEIKGTLPDASYSALSEKELFELYKMSVDHDVAHLAADALKRANALPSGKPQEAFMQQYTTALFRCEGFLHTIDEIRTAFCRHNIPFVMLKGSAIRKYYPEMWMRTSCDIDVLIKTEDVEKATEIFAAELSYERVAETAHDVSFTSDGNVHVELHFDTIEDYVFKEANSILAEIWNYATRVGDTSEYELTDEMLYFYHVAHTAKHFKNGGCGIRPIIDLWVLQKSKDFDINAGRELLASAGLGKFEETLTKLSKIWFDSEKYDDEIKKVEEYIINGGVYGNTESAVKLSATKKGKLKYILSRIFVPYKILQVKYPVLKKYKWLTPVFTVVRWFEMVFQRRLKDRLSELSTTIGVDKSTAKEYSNIISIAGLNEIS